MPDFVEAEGFKAPTIQEDDSWKPLQPVPEEGYSKPEPVPESDFWASLGAGTASHIANTAGAALDLHVTTNDEFTRKKTEEIQQREESLKNFDDSIKKRGFSTADDQNSRTAIQHGLDKARAELELYTAPGSDFDPARDPQKRQANAQLETGINQTGRDLREWAHEGVWDAYGANPHSENLGAQVGRGLGTMLATAPTALVNLPAAVIQGAGDAYGESYYQEEKKAREEGITDPSEVRDRAETAASTAALKTAPQLGLYVVGGKLTSTAVTKLLPKASPLVKALFGTGAAAATNVAVGGTIRKLEGQEFTPTIEQLTQDVAWGGIHGLGEYSTAHAELQQKALDHLSSTDTADKLEAAGLTEAAKVVRQNAETRAKYGVKPPEEKPPEPPADEAPPADDNVHAAEAAFINEEPPAAPPATPPAEPPPAPPAPAAEPPKETPPVEPPPAADLKRGDMVKWTNIDGQEQTTEIAHDLGNEWQMTNGAYVAKSKVTPAGSTVGTPGYSPDVYNRSIEKYHAGRPESSPAPAPVDATPAEREAIAAAYEAAVKKTGFPAVPIADVMEAAGFKPEEMDRARGILHDLHRKGEVVLSLGDWSIADNRERGWVIPLHGQDYLQVRFLPKTETPAAHPAPEIPPASAAPAKAAIGPIQPRAVAADDLPANGKEARGIRWFHGTGIAKLAADKVSSTFSKIESLFGSGVYLTDSPEVANSYGSKRGKGAGTVHEFKVDPRSILNFEKPLPPDAIKAIRSAAYEDLRPEIDAFLKANPKATGAQLWAHLADTVSDHSAENQWASSEYAEMFQGIESNLREAGYDAITHIGGMRVGDGTKQHRVLILLDPRNEYAPANSKNPNTVKDVQPYDPATRTEPEPIQRTRRSFSIPFAPLGVPDMVDFVHEQGGINLPPKAERRQEHDAAPEKLPGVYQRILSAKGRITPDEMAQMLYEHGQLRAPDVELMWRELEKAVNFRVSMREREASQRKTASEAQRVSARQTKAFDKDAGKPVKGTEAIHVENLIVGDTIVVKGENLKVTDIDPDTHDVTLDDGKKYGVQTARDGEVIYGEHIAGERPEDFFGDFPEPDAPAEETPAKPAENLPTLRAGEDQGDLLSKQTEDLTLIGEKGVDWQKRQQEKEQAERDKAEAAEIAARNQRTMFQAPEGAKLTPEQEREPQMMKPDGTPFWAQRERVHGEIDGIEGVTDEQKAGVKALLDARAAVWAKENGKTVNDYYRDLAFKTGDAAPSELRAKGKVTFFESGLKLVTAFREAADVSTLAHEIGHIFRYELNPQQLAVAEKWAGVDRGEWTVEAEERFARAFEKYLMEGKAPTDQLKPVFERFKDWMSRIYQGLRNFLSQDGSLSPAISDVFDSLLTGETMRSKGYVGFEESIPGMRREHAELFQGIRDVLDEIRDIPRFTPFKRAVNRLSYRMQRTFLETADIIAKTKEAIPDRVRRSAIGVYIEAKAEADRTGETHQQVLDRWATTNQAKKYQAKYDAARDLTPAETAFANRVETYFANKLGVAQSWGILDQGLEGYVRRIWKQPTEKQKAAMQSSSRLKTNAGFQKHRQFETAFEGEQPKVDPATGATIPGMEHLTDDIGEQMALYALELNKVIAHREMILSLSKITGADGRPAVYPRGGRGYHDPNSPTPPDHYLIYPRKMADVMNPTTGERESTFDYREIKNQRLLTKWKWMGEDEMGNPILLQADLMVHPEFATHVDRITKGSGVTAWAHSEGTAIQGALKALFRGVTKAQSLAKEAMFSLSGFHYATIAEHVLEHRVNPFPEVAKSFLNVATRIIPPLHRMVSRSLRLKMVDYNDPVTADWMRHGLMLAADRTAPAHFMEGVGGQSMMRRIPFVGDVAGTISDDLFHRFIPALKLRMANSIQERNMHLYAGDLSAGRVSVSDVKYLTGKQVNAATSHLNSIDLADSLLHDPTFRHFMSLTMLAPDFTESRMRFLGQGAKGLVSRTGREQLMALAIGGGILYATMRVVNSMLNDGDAKWDAKYAFSVVHGNRVYQVRSVQGDVIHAVSNWQGFAQGRLSPIARFAFTAGLAGVNYRGEKESALDAFGELLASYIPISLRELPGLRDLTKTQKNTPVSPWEQFAGTMGVHTSRYSPITETYQRARDWNKAQGQAVDKGVYPVSKYQQLRYALEDGDMDRAFVEYKKLRDSGLDRDKLLRGFKQSIDHPFTGTIDGDAKFARSLTGHDREVYKEAIRTRQHILQRFSRLH